MVQLRNVRTEVAKIVRELTIGECALTIASLSAFLLGGPATLPAILKTAVAVGRAWIKYANQIMTHPAYFLWRLKRESDRSRK